MSIQRAQPILLWSLSVVLVFACPTHASGVLDQYNIVPVNGRFVGMSRLDPVTQFKRAQTFRVGMSGILDHIDILIPQGETLPVMMRIRRTSAGLPTDDVVATTTSVSLNADGWTSFDLLPSHLAVRLDDVWAFEPLIAEGTSSSWTGGGPYSRGVDAIWNSPAGPWRVSPFSPDGGRFRTYLLRDATPTQVTSWGRVKGLYH